MSYNMLITINTQHIILNILYSVYPIVFILVTSDVRFCKYSTFGEELYYFWIECVIRV